MGTRVHERHTETGRQVQRKRKRKRKKDGKAAVQLLKTYRFADGRTDSFKRTGRRGATVNVFITEQGVTIAKLADSTRGTTASLVDNNKQTQR